MIIGLGSDLTNMERIAHSLERWGSRFEARCFTEVERARADRGPFTKAGTLARRFAAKEALMKALGVTTGIRWHDMEVVADAEGDPSFRLSGAAREIAERRGAARIHLTMSHDAGVAIAMVVAETAPERVAGADS